MTQSLGVGIIARNAEKTLRTCIQSFAEYADQIVVVLAGQSTDKTAREAKKGSKKVELYNFDWIDDFSAARNFSFSKLHTDWLLWVDSDDEVYQPENLKQLMENAADEVGAIWLPYHYAIDEFGNCTTLYERERLLHAKYGWVWKGRLHETVSPLRECKFVRSDDVIIRHNHLAGESRHERNFGLLNIMLKEDPTDKRVWLYMGHQNFAARNWIESAQWYLKFGSDTGAIPIERYQALCYCSKAMRELEDRQAIEVALMAIELCPNYRDAYLELAHSYLIVKDFDKCIHWTTLSEVKEIIHEPPHVIFINPLEYTFNKYLMLSEAYMKKGDLTRALGYMKEAYEVRPVPEIKNNVAYIQQLEVRNRTIESIKVQAVNLLSNREILKLKSLLDSTPYWFRDLEEYKTLEAGVKHYLSGVKEIPQLTEGKDGVIVNIGNSEDPVKLLAELDEKYEQVTVVCPIPYEGSQQFRAYSQKDMEELLISKEGRHILNLQREPSRIIGEYNKKVPQNLSIRFFLGQGLEYWSPKTIKEIGCGGSETWAAMTAKELALRDCQPLIYAMDTQIWDGVVYRHFSNFAPASMPSHLFISSRVPDVFYDEIPARQKWLWMHDIHCWNKLTPEVASNIDVIVTLSKWHAGHIKRVYPFLKDAEVIDLDNNPLTYDDQWTAGTFFEDARIFKLPKITIIGNGINTERFATLTEKRIPHRFVWCSSPDRGLEQVLDMWTLIRKAWADAELKIFYGWEYFDSSLFIPAQKELKGKLLKQIKQDGVEWCGRIGQEQLAKELMKASIMLYPPPSQFRETYGIAFLEAQAAGVLCFYRESGALGETIGNRGVPLKMDMKPEDIIDTMVYWLANTSASGILRDRGREYALGRSWATQTDKILRLYEIIENGRN